MPITLAQLLHDPELGLRLRAGHGRMLDEQVDWAATTEFPEPAPFLTGSELVLTTGMRLRSIRACRTFVTSLKKAGSRAIGFGIGFTHDHIPDALLDEARRNDLAVLEVPVEISFAMIARRVAQVNAHDRVETEYRRRERLVAQLLGDGGLESMLNSLSREVDAHVAVSVNGEVISGSLDLDDENVTGWDALPIALGRAGQATLHASRPRRDDELLNAARTLVGLHLAQASRRRRASRVQAGLIIGDLITGDLPPAAVASRLESIGLTPGNHYRMLAVAGTGPRQGDLAAMPLPSSLTNSVATALDDRLVVLLDTHTHAHQAAESLIAATSAAGIPAKVGIGGAYPASSSLRWSWHEAVDALDRLTGDQVIVSAPKLSIAALILGAVETPVAELAEEILAPIETHDREHGGQLVATLDAFLAGSGTPSAAASALGTHRNTVRYRLDQILKLTGLDPRVIADAVQLSLARQARRLTER